MSEFIKQRIRFMEAKMQLASADQQLIFKKKIEDLNTQLVTGEVINKNYDVIEKIVEVEKEVIVEVEKEVKVYTINVDDINEEEALKMAKELMKKFHFTLSEEKVLEEVNNEEESIMGLVEEPVIEETTVEEPIEVVEEEMVGVDIELPIEVEVMEMVEEIEESVTEEVEEPIEVVETVVEEVVEIVEEPVVEIEESVEESVEAVEEELQELAEKKPRKSRKKKGD